MDLATNSHLLHYRLVEKLGQGGMGEVWRAVDTKLDREVAIKVLPDAFAADADRLERFQREARVVARLSHPNIVTIYAVEQDGETRFVAMEIVRGRTLAELLPRKGLDLQRLFELAIPLTDAVCAAHRQGVTHRDLKPGNIMMSDDGRVKVLDFGLAKLAWNGPGAENLSQLPTRAVTAEGRILGTVEYMSPEQAEGKPVDHRSDIFSLGIVLYEMATGRRPFEGETPASTLSSILRDDPPSVTEIKRTLPSHFGRIVRRCLAKDPERRYQTAQDLRNDLEELQDEATKGTRPLAVAHERPRRRTVWVVSVTGAVALVLIGFLFRGFLRELGASHQPDGRSTPGTLEIVPLTRTGTTVSAGLSPDGRYLVYVRQEQGQYSLRVRQLATGSDQELLPPGEDPVLSPAVAPDLEWVYYALGTSPIAIWRLPILGGRPQKILDDIDGWFAFSPDGERIVFHRTTPENEVTLLVASADGSDARPIGKTDYPGPLAWSADGKEIYFSVPHGIGRRLAAATVSAEGTRVVDEEPWTGIWGLASLPNGSGILIAGNRGERSLQVPTQIFRVLFSGLVPERLTRDVETYSSLSLDATGTQLAAVQLRSEHSVWILPGGDQAQARRIAFTSQSGPYWVGVAWLPDGRVIYEDLEGERLQLHIARPDGSAGEPLTSAGTFNMGAAVSPDGKTVAYFSDRDGRFGIWLSQVDGGNARRLTDDPFEETFPRFSPDGRWIVYHVFGADGSIQLRRAPVAGGPSEPFGKESSGFPVVSPDGRWVAYTQIGADGRGKTIVADFETGEVRTTIERDLPSLPLVQWTPDGSGLAMTSVAGGVANVVVYPLGGGPPRQITRFSEGQVLGFAWAPDGISLAVALGKRSRDAVLITGFAPVGN